MQSHSAITNFFIITTFTPHGLLTPTGFTFYNKIYIKSYFVKLQTHFSQEVLFISCDIFPQVMVICLHLIKHVSLGFNIY